jgi:hypothetical protein
MWKAGKEGQRKWEQDFIWNSGNQERIGRRAKEWFFRSGLFPDFHIKNQRNSNCRLALRVVRAAVRALMKARASS